MLRGQGSHLGDVMPMLGFEECIGVFQMHEGPTGHSSPGKIDIFMTIPCPSPKPRSRNKKSLRLPSLNPEVLYVHLQNSALISTFFLLVLMFPR